ncbi:MAG: AMIN-like domain-containing (lipo)protein [Acidimicrobiales bacterium]
MRRFGVVLACLAIPLALGVHAATAGAGAGAQRYCGIVWGSRLKSAPDLVPTPVTGVRLGQHECYDRMVIDLSASPAPGYFVRYTDGVHTPGEGSPIAVSGGATLTITALAPSYDVDAGTPTVPWSWGTHIARPAFATFRDVVFAGSFEGESTFGLGVRARLPFRVLKLEGPSRLVIDVAHRW